MLEVTVKTSLVTVPVALATPLTTRVTTSAPAALPVKVGVVSVVSLSVFERRCHSRA